MSLRSHLERLLLPICTHRGRDEWWQDDASVTLERWALLTSDGLIAKQTLGGDFSEEHSSYWPIPVHSVWQQLTVKAMQTSLRSTDVWFLALRPHPGLHPWTFCACVLLRGEGGEREWKIKLLGVLWADRTREHRHKGISYTCGWSAASHLDLLHQISIEAQRPHPFSSRECANPPTEKQS